MTAGIRISTHRNIATPLRSPIRGNGCITQIGPGGHSHALH
jgi:hypothetical protein